MKQIKPDQVLSYFSCSRYLFAFKTIKSSQNFEGFPGLFKVLCYTVSCGISLCWAGQSHWMFSIFNFRCGNDFCIDLFNSTPHIDIEQSNGEFCTSMVEWMLFERCLKAVPHVHYSKILHFYATVWLFTNLLLFGYINCLKNYFPVRECKSCQNKYKGFLSYRLSCN